MINEDVISHFLNKQILYIKQMPRFNEFSQILQSYNFLRISFH